MGLLLGGALAGPTYAQAPRLRDANALAWFVYTGDHQLAARWQLHAEYQWRRVSWGQSPQQQLARLGVVRKLTDRVSVAGGYTYFQTHRYGAYPTVPGRAEPEQRLYQDVTLRDPLGRLKLTHRLRLEQRWLGSRTPDGRGPVRDWEYQNRVRYQLTAEHPLQGPTTDDGEFYLNAFDELFIGFGPNVGDNVFNQNRLAGGVGYQLAAHAAVELNYLFQISQHPEPDPASGRPVVEFNQGFRLNVRYDLNFTAAPDS